MTGAQVHDFEVYQRLAVVEGELEGLRTRLDGRDDGGGMTSDKTDLTDHKIALSEARQETKLARLEGKIDLLGASITTLGSKIDTQRSEAASGRNLIIVTVIASALSALALFFAVLSYGASTFVNGTTVRDIVHSEVGAVGGKPPAASSKP